MSTHARHGIDALNFNILFSDFKHAREVLKSSFFLSMLSQEVHGTKAQDFQ
jgi:hypothetical protein